MMKALVKRLLGIKTTLPDEGQGFATLSFSQEGEDMILRRIFPQVSDGFYVDIGAHHPYRFSNTFYFYKIGWTGINIDPIPGTKSHFDAIRSRDINLEVAIAGTRALLNYFNFKEKALNTFSENLAKQYQDSNWELENVIAIETFTLAEILDRNMPKERKIDFMTIDVEDLELQVLRSNNWEKYRPAVLVVEILNSSIQDIIKSEVVQYLKTKGYLFFAKTVNSCFFKFEN